MADDLDVEWESLLFSSPSRDPMWKGTDTDHKKAEWFATQWRRAVHDRSEDSIHPRGVHYTLIQDVDEPVRPPTARTSWDEYENTTKCYDYLVSCSVLARILGYVPLDGVRDQKNESTVLTKYGQHSLDPAHDAIGPDYPDGVSVPNVPRVEERAGYNGLSTIARQYAKYAAWMIEFDRPRQQPFHVEIWSEKAAPDVLHDLADQYAVNAVVEGEGDLSYRVAHDLVQRINEGGKPAVILYLSDFDPKGDNMATAMSSKIAWLDEVGELEQRVMVKQMAVTQDQIEEYDLPRAPIDTDTSADASTGKKAYRTLVTEWEERKGTGAVELQAMWRDEGRFAEVVEHHLQRLYDPTIRDLNSDRLKEFRQEVRNQARSTLEDADLDDAEAEIEEWIEEFNGTLQEAEEYLERLNDMQNAAIRSEWSAAVEHALADVEFPDVDPPEGDGHEPARPLYDSKRPYKANVDEINAHREGERDTL